MIHISLKDFLVSGHLGPLHLGMSRTMVQHLLGAPDQVSTNSNTREHKRLPPSIWKYGDIELHFEDEHDSIFLICLDDFEVPSGGEKINLDPWILRREVDIANVQAHLTASSIPYHVLKMSYDDENTARLQLDMGIHLIFTLAPTEYGPPQGLTCITFQNTMPPTEYTN